MFVFLFLILLCTRDSKFIHLILTDSNLFLYIVEKYSTIHTHIHTTLAIHLSVDIWVASMSCYCKQCCSEHWVLVELWFSQGICPAAGLLGHMAVLFLVFYRNLHTVFHSERKTICSILLYILFNNFLPLLCVCMLMYTHVSFQMSTYTNIHSYS